MAVASQLPKATAQTTCKIEKPLTTIITAECYTRQYEESTSIPHRLKADDRKMAASLRKDVSASDAMVNVLKIPPLRIGDKIRLITCLGTELQGTVDAFEEKTKMLILSILNDRYC